MDNKLLKVYALGPFKIKLSSKQVKEKDWKSFKTLKLFKLLLINYGKEISSEQIVDKIWPDTKLSKGVKRVYDTVYQLRKVLDNDQADESYIIKSPPGYSLNQNKDYWFDWEEFTAIYKRYKHINLEQKLDESELSQAVKELETAFNLYQGDFMANDLYETWVELPRIHYREIMLNLTMLLAKIYYKLHDNEKALDYLELGIAEEPYREDFYLLAMKILRQENRCWKVAFLYKKCKEAMEKELGISPSERLKKEYNKLNNNQYCTTEAVNSLANAGALRCDAAAFKEIYRLEQRKMEREEHVSLLLKITFDYVFSSQLFEELIIRISSRLRSEDVITKWDEESIYILLSQASLKNNLKISHRIFDSLFLTEVGNNPQLLWEEVSKDKNKQQQKFVL